MIKFVIGLALKFPISRKLFSNIFYFDYAAQIKVLVYGMTFLHSQFIRIRQYAIYILAICEHFVLR